MELGGASGVIADDAVDGEIILDELSIIRLLRAFVGAVHPHQAPAPVKRETPLSPSRKRPRHDRIQAHESTLPWQARESAGCTLWDASISEPDATRMYSAGLLPVACAVLRQCAEASCTDILTVPAEPGEHSKGSESGSCNAHQDSQLSAEEHVPNVSEAAGSAAAGAGAPAGAPSGLPAESSSMRVESVTTKGVEGVAAAESGGAGDLGDEGGLVVGGHDEGVSRLDVEGAVRLREITCGLLANTSSHRSLRQQIVGHASLGEELLQVLHSSDDPACLTEVLRLLSSVVGCLTATGVGALGVGLVARPTLERLVFFLENSLEDKLLARTCSLSYALMYHCQDVVTLPLVQEFGVEQAFASLLNSRRTDLSYEQVGSAETGLDVLLRCLEVLSLSDVSCLGPIPVSGKPTCDSLAGGAGSQGKVQCVVAAEASLGKNEFDDAAIETSSGYRSEAASRTVHHSVIRGLVAVLMPWEHSKRSQQAALLVLGNMIENDLENDLEKDLQSNPEHGPDDAKEIAGSVVDVRGDGDETPAAWGSRGCVEALADALAAQSFVGTEDGGDDAVDDVRLAGKRKDFLNSVSEALDGEDVKDEDLLLQLRDASALVEKTLQREALLR